jgi:hypothetical protein
MKHLERNKLGAEPLTVPIEVRDEAAEAKPAPITAQREPGGRSRIRQERLCLTRCARGLCDPLLLGSYRSCSLPHLDPQEPLHGRS